MFKIENCECGKEHICDIEVICERGAINRIPGIIKDYDVPFVIADINTYKEMFDIYDSFIFTDKELIPDEKAIGKGLIAMPKACDILIGVGSGTINDICRYLSFKLNIPYIIVATAPSMDGYTSSVSPLIVDNMKVTYTAQYPKYVIADLNIIMEAPYDMIIAGVGDIIGKYTCLCDWELSHVINNEYYCKNIADLVEQSIKKCVENLEGFVNREEIAIKNVMDALILSGIAMSYAGNSRPASGAEHHISHYWEMDFMFKNRKPVLHGIKVGLATVVISELYRKMSEVDINKSIEKHFVYDEWIENIKNIYGKAADGVIELENKCNKNKDENIKRRCEAYKSNWDEIMKIIEMAPSPEKIISIMKTIKAPSSLTDIGVDKETFYNSIIGSKDLRDRYTILEMASDLCLSDRFGNELYY